MSTDESARRLEVAPPRFYTSSNQLDGGENLDNLACVLFGSIDQGRNYAIRCTEANRDQ